MSKLISLIFYFNFKELELLLDMLIMITMIYNITAFSSKLYHDLFEVIKYTFKNKVYSSLLHAVSKRYQ